MKNVKSMDKKHWYSFSYADGSGCQASTYTGYESLGVTLPMIMENKVNAHVSQGAVLLAVCYLGHMTKSEFLEQDK